MKAARVAVGALLAFAAYEALRAYVGRRIRANVPDILQAELAARSPAAGILAPLLGTPVVSEAVAAVVQQTFYDTLPTIIGPKRYDATTR